MGGCGEGGEKQSQAGEGQNWGRDQWRPLPDPIPQVGLGCLTQGFEMSAPAKSQVQKNAPLAQGDHGGFPVAPRIQQQPLQQHCSSRHQEA